MIRSIHSFGNPAAMVFDFDGVIVDTEWAVYTAWREVFAEHGCELPLPLYSQCVGSDYGTWDPREYLESLTPGRPDWEVILPAKDARTRAMLRGSEPMPGVVEWLEFLSERDIPVVVASSSSRRWVAGWLEELGLIHYFQGLHTRDDVERVKPAPDLFLRAVQALGLPPERILVIEDSANGVRAADGAGLPVLAVPNRVTAHQDFSAALAVLPSLAALHPGQVFKP